MTFEEILNQAIALLQRQGRVSYRALKRQFDLDEAYVEDLKLELIEVHRVAVDHPLNEIGDHPERGQQQPVGRPRARRQRQAARCQH